MNFQEEVKFKKGKYFGIRLLIAGICILGLSSDERKIAFITVTLCALAIIILLIKDKIVEDKSKLRTKIIEATIVNIKREEDVEHDYIQVTCKAIYEKDVLFKSEMVIEQKKWKIGDRVSVSVEPENYNNYHIEI